MQLPMVRKLLETGIQDRMGSIRRSSGIEFLRQREARRGGHGGGGARRGLRAGRRREEDESDEDRQGGSTGKGASGNPPEWDGTTSFQDWLIKARLWLATTRARPKTQGLLILQRLSGPAFQAFKHWARDAEWLQDDRGGFKQAMNSPDQFGDDKEEDLLASLAKITYHIRRGREEGLRTFFARWDESLRKVREHSVTLPDKYLGFLLINALIVRPGDQGNADLYSRVNCSGRSEELGTKA